MVLIVLLVSLLCAEGAHGQEARPPLAYLGESLPGNAPVSFAPEIITRELHSSPVFSPRGDEVFWGEMDEGIFGMVLVDGEWGPRTEASFNLPYSGEPVFSVGGDAVYFASQHAHAGSQRDWDEDVWRVVRTESGWSPPEPLGPAVNDHPMHWGVSLAENGNLYFGRTGDTGDIYVSEFKDDAYQEAVPLGRGVNSNDGEGTPHVAPDEAYLVFSRNAPEGIDLFVSFRRADGSWGDAMALNSVNTPDREICPRVSPDGEFLFFLRREGGDLKPYWVSSSVLTELAPHGETLVPRHPYPF